MTNLQIRLDTQHRSRWVSDCFDLLNRKDLYFNPLEFIDDDCDLVGALGLVAAITGNLDRPKVNWDNFYLLPSNTVLAGVLMLTKWVASMNGDTGLANPLMAIQILNLPNLTARLIANQERIPSWIYQEFSALTLQAETTIEPALLLTCIKLLAPIVSTQLETAIFSIEYSKKIVRYNDLLDRLLPLQY